MPDPYEIRQRLPSLLPTISLFRGIAPVTQETYVVKPGMPHLLRIAVPDHPGMGELADRAWYELDRMGKEPVLVFHVALYAPELGIPAIAELIHHVGVNQDSWYEAMVPFTPQYIDRGETLVSVDIFLNQFLLVSLQKKLMSQEGVHQNKAVSRCRTLPS